MKKLFNLIVGWIVISVCVVAIYNFFGETFLGDEFESSIGSVSIFVTTFFLFVIIAISIAMIDKTPKSKSSEKEVVSEAKHTLREILELAIPRLGRDAEVKGDNLRDVINEIITKAKEQERKDLFHYLHSLLEQKGVVTTMDVLDFHNRNDYDIAWIVDHIDFKHYEEKFIPQYKIILESPESLDAIKLSIDQTRAALHVKDRDMSQAVKNFYSLRETVDFVSNVDSGEGLRILRELIKAGWGILEQQNYEALSKHLLLIRERLTLKTETE